jgi:hypothetical protein
MMDEDEDNADEFEGEYDLPSQSLDYDAGDDGADLAGPAMRHHGRLDPLHYIRRAYRRGRGGYMLNQSQLSQQTEAIINLDLPEWMSREWTVTLCDWDFGGLLTGQALPIGAGQPADNQLNTSGFLKAFIEWGVSGAKDTASIDYPPRGMSFNVVASSLRVSFLRSGISTGPTVPGPLIGAWAAPYKRSAMYAQPLFTAPYSLLTTQQSIFPSPSHAVGYNYTITSLAGLAAGALVIEQVEETGALVQQQDVNVLPSANDLTNPSIKQAYYRLHPRCQFVRMTNNTAGTINGTLQWLLDLG